MRPTRTMVLLSCLALTACGDSGVNVGGTVTEVIFPGGTTADFEIGQVTIEVQCTGQVNSGLHQNAQPADGTSFIASLEFENLGQNGQEVWASILDLRGDCVFKISASEPDGEQFCSGQATTTVDPGDNDKVSIILNCDVSQYVTTGRVDLDATPI